MLYVSEPARLSAQSALCFGGVRDLCAFFELMRPVRCTASTPAGSRHCRAPPLAQFTLIVFKSARTVLGSVSAALLLLFARLASCACTFWPAHQGSQGQPKPRPFGAFKIFVLFMRLCAWVTVACVSVMNNDMHCVTAWEWERGQRRGNSSKLVRNSNRCKTGVVTIDFRSADKRTGN